jgi:hypothetical protein
MKFEPHFAKRSIRLFKGGQGIGTAEPVRDGFGWTMCRAATSNRRLKMTYKTF